ncbi:MAG: YbjQ family protein [Candidatus Sericytochromatia bacterium]
MELLILAVMVSIGYFAGSHAEKTHYASIIEREKAFTKLPTTNLKHPPQDPREVEWAQLVNGNAVMAVDYFKLFVASLRNLFGGRVSAYESVIDRARREATLRMQEMARKQGADMIINLRVETASIGGGSAGQKNGLPSIEAMVYGTAVRYRR